MSDLTPIVRLWVRGIVLGGGKQELNVQVTVTPLPLPLPGAA